MDKNKTGVSRKCETCSDARIPIVPNDTFQYMSVITKHVRMLRVSRFGYERVEVCTMCEAVTSI